MSGNRTEDGRGTRLSVLFGLAGWLIRASFVIGLTSTVYCLYDLAKPGHFVGDMYGLEVILRLAWLAPLGLACVVGTTVAELARRRAVILTSGTVAAISAIGLLLQACETVKSRHEDSVRKTYPGLSTPQLLRIARQQDNQFAVDALAGRRDSAAVDGLGDVLLDEALRPALRICAAQHLGNVDTPEARRVLEQAYRKVRDTNVRYALGQVLRSHTPPTGQAPGQVVPQAPDNDAAAGGRRK